MKLDLTARLAQVEELDRMLAEVPSKYLEPVAFPPEAMPPGVKKVGQLTDRENRLLGVIDQLAELIELEKNAHYDSREPNHQCTKACLPFHERMLEYFDRLDLLSNILRRSLQLRLEIPGHEFCYDGYDIYSFPDIALEALKQSFESLPPENDFLANFNPDPKDIN